jgi:hypothetical protein
VGEVFAEIVDTTLPTVAFGGSNSGGTSTAGVVTPNLAISALSRVLGPVGGGAPGSGGADTIGSLAGGSVPDVGAFLKNFFDNDAKILGAIPLSDIIHLPDLTPIFQVLSLVQAVESAPDTLKQMVNDAISKLQGRSIGAQQAGDDGTTNGSGAATRGAGRAQRTARHAQNRAQLGTGPRVI